MKARGVRDARCTSWQQFEEEQFDTMLLLMHGIGVVGDLTGLREFLEHAKKLLAVGSQLLFDSADLAETFAAEGMDLSEIESPDDGYHGEVWFDLEFDGLRGEEYPWLFVDPQTLSTVAAEANFSSEVIAHGSRGSYLARLVRSEAES